jgi:hypothetical protein
LPTTSFQRFSSHQQVIGNSIYEPMMAMGPPKKKEKEKEKLT